MVEGRQVTETIQCNAEVVYDASRHARLASRAPGIVHEVQKSLGQPVAAGKILADRHEPDVRKIYKAGEKYLSSNLPLEDVPNIGRAILFAKKDGVDLIVNVKPFSCMPGNIVEAVLQELSEACGVPTISLSYEGGEGTNRPIRDILENLQ